MSILLFIAGAVTFVAGAVMIGFGIPINEFSFGNTLILAGTVSIVGGVLATGLGAAVSHLQTIADALARVPGRAGRPTNAFEPSAGIRPAAAPGRVPFPPRPKSEPKSEEKAEVRPEPKAELRAEPRNEARPDFGVSTPAPFVPLMDDEPARIPVQDDESDHFVPALPNPDEPPVTVEDEVSLSPFHPMAPAAPTEAEEPDRPVAPGSSFDSESPSFDGDDEPPLDDRPDDGLPPPAPDKPTPARPTQSTYFDAMWPAEPKAAPSKSADSHLFEPRSVEPIAQEPKISEAKWEDTPPVGEDPSETFHDDPHDDEPAPDDGPRAVAILKSGVVDGMGYTLYVDGSIEAELPQGTLRFASINELRSHLEKTP